MDAAERIARIIASEISASPAQVAAATGLLDGGATVPFVARYRKEGTGGLDDTQLRNLAERLSYLRELESRRTAILESIRGQGKLTEDLARAIAGAAVHEIFGIRVKIWNCCSNVSCIEIEELSSVKMAFAVFCRRADVEDDGLVIDFDGTRILR